MGSTKQMVEESACPDPNSLSASEDGVFLVQMNNQQQSTKSQNKYNDFGINNIGSVASTIYTKEGYVALILLALQNSAKNVLLRYVMKDSPKFLTSVAVIGSEFTKLSLSVCYILFVHKNNVSSIFKYLKDDQKNTLLLAVPASAYNLQMSLEYIALANLNAAVFSVLVQTKLLFTATFASFVLKKKLKCIQVISLVLLTIGVMLCNLSKVSDTGSHPEERNSGFDEHLVKGVVATLGIALSSGFASVYTEKVIKAAQKSSTTETLEYGLAYTQVQLSIMSILAIGVWAMIIDFAQILEFGLFHNFTTGAMASVFMSAIGGLIVAGVLKYADSVIKGYATACSVIITGILSMIFFGTSINYIYLIGIVHVILALLMYNGNNFDYCLRV